MIEELNKANRKIEGKLKIVEAMSSLSWVMSQNRDAFDEEGVRKGFDDYMLVFLGWLLGWRFKWQSELVTAQMENSMMKSMLEGDPISEDFKNNINPEMFS